MPSLTVGLPPAAGAKTRATISPTDLHPQKRIGFHALSGAGQFDTFLGGPVLAINFNPLAFMTSSRESTILEDKCLDTF
jgi:hypothetical protein